MQKFDDIILKAMMLMIAVISAILVSSLPTTLLILIISGLGAIGGFYCNKLFRVHYALGSLGIAIILLGLNHKDFSYHLLAQLGAFVRNIIL